MNTDDIMNDHYSNYEEDVRFNKDKAHRIEFLTTVKYIDKYLKLDDKILEIGAGTGAYAIHYAKQGYEVDAIELVQTNLDILNTKTTPDMKINAKQGNALNLEIYADNTFDITLVLGPLYHLFTVADRKQAINEAVRVTKPNGIIYIAYLTNDSIIANYFLRKGHIAELPESIKDKSYRLIDSPKEVFTGFHIDEFNQLVDLPNLEKIAEVAADGIGYLLREYVDALSEDGFKLWLDYHFATCENRDLQGYSSHMLYICKKKDQLMKVVE
jgi:ubiquinone/menaquinone biosynthesis C-methylase UbiE